MMNAIAALKSESPPKYESPYASRPISQNPTPVFKRRHSETVDQAEQSDEKRQRVEVDTSDSIDIDALIAQASSDAIANVTTGRFAAGNTQGNGYRSYRFNTEPIADQVIYMKSSSAPILENLSTQILSLMLHGTYAETVEIFTNQQSDKGQRYHITRSLLDQTKKMYNTAGQTGDFLQVDQYFKENQKYQSIIWSTNLAILAGAIFGGTEDWDAIHTLFLDIIAPRLENLNIDACNVYLNFATQMVLSTFGGEEQQMSLEESLSQYFPLDLERRLLARHPDQELTAVEYELVQMFIARRNLLAEESGDLSTLAKLMEEYTWDDFLLSFFTYVKVTHQDKIPEHDTPSNPAPDQDSPSQDTNQDHQDAPAQNLDALISGAVDTTLQVINMPKSAPDMSHIQADMYGEQYASGLPIVPSQSQPTAILYSMARQQAASKNSSNNRRGSGGLSARRPWSMEEENALMAGLDQVKGAHWSQILSLYGPNGTINHILEHRNQVQLKDKARNLKLFFLKSGIEVPYYLSSVTGELKTRAPSQAARKEAEERARLTSDESVARSNTIMTLASGFQQSISNNGSSNVLDSIESPHGDNHGLPHHSRSPSQEQMNSGEASRSDDFNNEGFAAALKESILGENQS